jgi:hypothetical protein
MVAMLAILPCRQEGAFMNIGCNMFSIPEQIVTILLRVSGICPKKGELATFGALEGKMVGRLLLMASCILVLTLLGRESLYSTGD